MKRMNGFKSSISLALIGLQLLTCMLSNVHGWGFEAHRITANIAQHFLSPPAYDAIFSILEPKYRGHLGPIASWADEIKRNSKYSWSRTLHYVDSNDDPPRQCHIALPEECEHDFCLTTATANYTRRLQDCRLSTVQRNEALKFLTHFIGDIAQPMHVSGRARGGNEAHCIFDGKQTQFHAVWDYLLIEKHIKVAFKNEEDFTSYMIDSLESGPLSINRTEWEACIPSAKSPTGIECINQWAVDTNKVSCSAWNVYEQGGDLGRGLPYERMAGLMEIQIAKGGIWLASFLNTVLEKKCSNLETWPNWQDLIFQH